MSLEQLEDDIVDERMAIIAELVLKGVVPMKDWLRSINCISVDCKPIENCGACGERFGDTPVQHFEIPQLLNGSNGKPMVDYLGSVDKQNKFNVYSSWTSLSYRKFKRRGADKPYVVIECTPNENNKYDCWLFNAPFVREVSIIGVFKDLRQLEEYGCCSDDHFMALENMSFLNSQIKDRITAKKIKYYRQLAAPVLPNDQTLQP